MTDIPPEKQQPKLRVGIAGLGVASTLVIPELATHPHVTLTAAADPRQVALDRFAAEFNAETHTTVAGMCASPNVDAVYVLTPNHLHAEHALTAVEQGKQVIVDKPLALTLDDCEAVIVAAERRGVRVLVGHTQSLDQPILKMAALVRSGELGRPLMIHSFFYSDWLYRPRSAVELDPRRGEGLVHRQGPVQVDIARMMGGGLVRSVRAMTSRADPSRPVEGSYTAYLEFEDGTPASLVYSGYGHFDSTEFTYGIGLSGVPVEPDAFIRSRKRIQTFTRPEEEWVAKDAARYGGAGARSHAAGAARGNTQKRHAFFGVTIVSCERGDIRQSPTGLSIYGGDARREIPVEAGEVYDKRYTSTEIDLMYHAWSTDRPLASHDGRWGKATLEVCLGILQSAQERREVSMHCQTAYAL